MKTLRTYEQVAQEDPLTPVYVIAACPEWPHYDSKECPAVIRAWIEQHYPEVVIEPLSGLSFHKTVSTKQEYPHGFLLCHLPRPLFRIGFSEEQADHFFRAWSSPPLDTPEAPRDFYWLTNERAEDFRISDEIDFTVYIDSDPDNVDEVE